MVTVLVVACALCAAVFFTAWGLGRLAKCWRSLPDFHYNYVGGVYAVCGVNDYKRAIVADSIIYPPEDGGCMVVVPETLVFSSNDGPWAKKFAGSATSLWCSRLGPALNFGFDKASTANDLFVPYTSERHMSFTEQEKVFGELIGSLEGFTARKKTENRSADARLRFRDWVHRREETLGVAIFLSVVAAIVLAAALGLVVMDRKDAAHKKEMAAVYLTSPGSSDITAVRATRHELGNFVVGGSSYSLIRAGRVTRIQPIGGGATWVCVKSVGRSENCGFADSSQKLVLGGKLYLRAGNNLYWRQGGLNHHEPASWAITEQEALALRDKAKFPIQE